MLNGAGWVAFVASLTGGPANAGLFVGTPGSVQAVAFQGTAAPAGGNFTNLFDGPALNGVGQVAFTANLTGGTSTQGLFAGTPANLEAVVLVGQVIDVDPGLGVVNRTVSSVSYLAGSGGKNGTVWSFNDAGLITYRLDFTDGSSGVFTSQVTPVPEPATVGLLAAAGLGVVRAVRRSNRRFLL